MRARENERRFERERDRGDEDARSGVVSARREGVFGRANRGARSIDSARACVARNDEKMKFANLLAERDPKKRGREEETTSITSSLL